MNLPDITQLLQAPVLVVLVICTFAGLVLKQTPAFRNWLIPYCVGGIGGVAGWALLDQTLNSLCIGIALGGISVYGHQLVTQFLNKDGGNGPTKPSGTVLPLFGAASLASLALLYGVTGCATTGATGATTAQIVAQTEAWVTANVLPGLPGLIGGGVALSARAFIKNDADRQAAAAECYAIAHLVRSTAGGSLPTSNDFRSAIQSAGGGGPLLDISALADMACGYLDPYLKELRGDQNVKFALSVIEATAEGFERGAALILGIPVGERLVVFNADWKRGVTGRANACGTE